MHDLTPQMAVQLANSAYQIKDKNKLGRYAAPALDYLAKDFDFDLSNNVMKGVSGTFMEHLFDHKTGFAVIGKGKQGGQYQGHHVIAFRGTASKRDAITDLHCGLSTSANNLPVHAGFNKSFNSMKSALETYFTKNDMGPVHCVGHSLGGALATLAANWLKARYKGRPVNLYTFGSPRIGYEGFANQTKASLNKIYRCIHAADPVPLVPLWPFVHTNGEYLLNAGPSISAEAHKMAGNAPGYINTASSYKDFKAINKHSGQQHKEQIRLDYEKRNQASFTSQWAHRIGATLVTLLRDSGMLAGIQVAITSTLTLYDNIALALTKIAKISD
ncbi:lipase family protein [Psychromonas aquimarina]|uniref:lipase family protein n=1 Tax=Psychromonas aquimarina TaxID=444919 RepID=UPI00040C944E|nr:lipase family protein [Psychromonas aquimarina]